MTLLLSSAASASQEAEGGSGDESSQASPAEVEAQPGEALDEPSSDGDDGEERPAEEGELSVEEEPAPLAEELPTLQEAEPFKWSLDSALALVTGRETFSAKDDKIAFRLGTTVQIDGTGGSGSSGIKESIGDVPSSINFRRFVIATHGHYADMNFKVALDLGAASAFRDVWVEGADGGLSVWGHHMGKFRLGQTKEPFGLERQGSGSFTAFLERSLPTQTFAPGHNIGALVHDCTKSQRQSWAFGIFSLGSQNEDSASGSSLSMTGRWTGLPIYEDDGDRLLHVGASVSSRRPGSRSTRYFSRPEARYVQPYADTGEIDVSNATLFGLELAGVRGPYWAQAEWIQADLDAQLVGNPDFSGFYLQAGWMLSGQTRPYQRANGTFDRLRPETNYHGGRLIDPLSGGAFEFTGRISHVDLSDGGVSGGKLTDYSLGVNWYATQPVRVQLNYIHAVPEDVGSSNIVLLRLQYNPW